MVGGGGRDNMNGGGSNDFLNGGGGNDRLNGGGGRDELIAGGGRDPLVVGGGADVFTFRSSDSVNMIRDCRSISGKTKILNGANSFENLRIPDFQGDAMIKFGRTTIRLDRATAACSTLTTSSSEAADAASGWGRRPRDSVGLWTRAAGRRPTHGRRHSVRISKRSG